MPCRQLRVNIEQYRFMLKQNSGAECVFTESGPVGMVIIDAILRCLEELQNRIEELERSRAS